MTQKERILDTTANLFITEGCKSLTMDDIASKNGISKRTLYEQFTDKQTLLEACINYQSAQFVAYIKDLEATTANVLELLIKMHDAQFEKTSKMRDNFVSEVERYFPDVYERTFAKLRSLQKEMTLKALIKGQQQEVFLPQIYDIGLTAFCLTEVMQYVKAAATSNSINKSDTYFFRSTMIYFLRGLSTDKGRAILDTYLSKILNK